MATMPLKNDSAKMSFAKVAASAGKENITLTSPGKALASSSGRDVRKQGPAVISHNLAAIPKVQQSANSEKSSVSPKVHPVLENNTGSAVINSKLVDAVKSLSVHDTTPSLVVNGSGTLALTANSFDVETSPEDPFQRVDSGSDLGTKPASLDGKSITSGTTYALDEKESLRPDDSASVKAAEDDDTFSGRGSIVAGSRIGSEAAGRAYRAQTYDVQDRRTIVPALERQAPGTVTPQSGSSGQQVLDGLNTKPLVGPAGAPDGFSLFYKQTPDEKLLEALESPKDRIFLLRLEQDVIEFVKDSKEPFVDLPPCNSFCRMLTHKLADYYHMTHQFDAVAGSVRIFRTPFCRLPPSLSSISNPPTTGNTPPPQMPAMKIMRRGGEGDTGGSPSKTTSETGSDGKDKSLSAREKLSREEREAAYNKARERIFGNTEKAGDATPDTEDGNDMSRSSSVSVKDRSGQSKRGKPGKQRRDDSESFDVRSQYTPFFAPQQQQQPTWTPVPQFVPVGMPQQFVNPMQNSFQAVNPPSFPQSPQQFNPVMMGPGGGMPPFNQMAQQYPRPNAPQYQPHNQVHSAPMSTYGSPSLTPPQQPQSWQPQNVYPNPYQSRGPVQTAPQTIPYPYGQLPSTANPADPKSQHPIPGSFNRHAFNPKTQSFVPGSQGMAPQQQMPHHGSPHMPYNGYAPPPQQFGNGLGYNMSRQGSNTSLPSYHASPHMASRPMMHQNMPSHHSIPAVHQGMAPISNGSHLPHFGNASTLPPKPPPAQM